MSSSTDHRWGMKEESTFGVAVTVDRFYPWLEVEPDWDNRLRYAQGLASGGGARTVLANRSVAPQASGGGETIRRDRHAPNEVRCRGCLRHEGLERRVRRHLGLSRTGKT
jgi:hypothetical protein